MGTHVRRAGLEQRIVERGKDPAIDRDLGEPAVLHHRPSTSMASRELKELVEGKRLAARW